MNKIVGNTKLQELKIFETFGNRIFIKDESINPSGSIKDRTVYQMLCDYRQQGLLKEGTTIVEATSGNTGISLAFFQKEFGYKAIIVLPVNASIKRRTLIKKYGGELELVGGGMKECKERANQLVNDIPNSFMFNQFECPSNVKAHLLTAKEIDDELDDVDYIFAGFGTGGTVTGIATYYKDKNAHVIAIEPEESPLITKGYAAKHSIEGIGANFVPPLLNKEVISEFITVNSDEAKKMARILNENGFNVGISSGANFVGAMNYISLHHLKDKNIVVIFPDKGDRYIW